MICLPLSGSPQVCGHHVQNVPFMVCDSAFLCLLLFFCFFFSSSSSFSSFSFFFPFFFFSSSSSFSSFSFFFPFFFFSSSSSFSTETRITIRPSRRHAFVHPEWWWTGKEKFQNSIFLTFGCISSSIPRGTFPFSLENHRHLNLEEITETKTDVKRVELSATARQCGEK